MKSVEEITQDCYQRQSDQVSRLGKYELFKNAVFGTEQQVHNRTMDGLGRPILRMQDIRSELRARRGAPNFLAPIVDNFTALRGQIPLMRAVPDSDEEQDREKATTRTRVARAFWQHSNMDLQQAQAGFYLSAYGDCLYMLDPLLPEEADELNPTGVYITVYKPSVVFPKMRTGRWGQEMEDVYICWEIDKETAQADYAAKPRSERCDVIYHYNRTEKYVVVGDQLVSYVKHDLGWVPGQWVRNKYVGDIDAQSDISQAIDVHEELQALMLVLSDASIESTYAPIKVRDPLNVSGDRIVIGPRAVIAVTATGDVERVQPAPQPKGAEHLLSLFQEALYHITGTTPVQQEGSIDHSNISGRAVHASQGALETRLVLSQTVHGHHFERLNQKMLLMLEKVPDLAQAELDIRGEDKGQPFSMKVKGAEVGGMCRFVTKWDALNGSSRHERLVMALQAYQQGLVPGTYVVEQLGEEDPEAVVRQAINEKMAFMKAQAAIQQASGMGGPPQQGGPPDQANPTIDATQSLMGGGMGQNGGGQPPPQAGVQPPPPSAGTSGGGGLPPFPQSPVSPAQQGMGQAQPKPDMDEQVRLALSGLNLLGTVNGWAWMQDGLVIYDPNWKDNSKIKKALSGLVGKVSVDNQHGVAV